MAVGILNLNCVLIEFFLPNQKSLRLAFKTSFYYKITFWIMSECCKIHRSYFVIKKLGLNACIKFFYYTNKLRISSYSYPQRPPDYIFYGLLEHCTFLYFFFKIANYLFYFRIILRITPLRLSYQWKTLKQIYKYIQNSSIRV